MFFGSLFLLPLFFENIQGKTALTAGELLISQGLAMGGGIALSEALYNWFGPRILAATGLALLVVGTYRLTQLDVNTTGLSLQIWLVLRGLGLGFTIPALQTVALSKVSNRAMARASSLVTVTRMVASAIGVASLTTYLTQQATSHGLAIGQAIRVGLTTHQFSGIAATCARLAGSTSNQAAVQTCVAQHAATQGLNDTLGGADHLRGFHRAGFDRRARSSCESLPGGTSARRRGDAGTYAGDERVRPLSVQTDRVHLGSILAKFVQRAGDEFA